MLSQFSHNCLKTVSNSSQFVFIHFLRILNISKIERCFFGKNAKSIILPVQIFVGGQMFFGEKTISLSFFRFFCTLGKRLPHFGRKRLGNLLQFALCVSRKSFWKKTSWKKLPSTFVLTLGRTTFPDFQQSFLDLHFINFIFFLEQNVELKICLKIRVYSFSHFCTWGFRTSDKWVESVFSQLP